MADPIPINLFLNRFTQEGKPDRYYYHVTPLSEMPLSLMKDLAMKTPILVKDIEFVAEPISEENHPEEFRFLRFLGLV